MDFRSYIPDSPTASMSERRKRQELRTFLQVGDSFILDGKAYVIETASQVMTLSKTFPRAGFYVEATGADGERLALTISYLDYDASRIIGDCRTASDMFGLLGEGYKAYLTELCESVIAENPQLSHIHDKDEIAYLTIGYSVSISMSERCQHGFSFPFDDVTCEEIVSGSSLPCKQRNAYVDGRSVNGSGVASHMYVSDGSVISTQDVIDRLVPISEFCKTFPQLFVHLVPVDARFSQWRQNDKGRNLRTFVYRYTPLAMAIRWELADGRLVGTPVLVKPLSAKAKTVYADLLHVIDENREPNIESRYRFVSSHATCVSE